MDCIQNVTPDIYWVGGSDRRLAMFENMFPLENGVTYNSFFITDEKTALIDTVDAAITRQFFENLEAVLKDRALDYLVINHMEPDHCANIEEICRRWPDVKIVGNNKTFQFIKQFYGMDLENRTIEVKEGAQLNLGKHNLQFIMAPMVHWPEVMMTYDATDKVLFSADAFGTFGGFTGNLFSDQVDYQNLYLDETRRYYTNIVGKFGLQVQSVIKKLCNDAISFICPLHGPVLRSEEIDIVLEKYSKWDAYQPEKQGVVLAYASMYGNTEAVVNKLAGILSQKGVRDMRIYDVSKTHYSYIISDIFKYSNLVLASTTYNKHLYSAMDTLIRDIGFLNIQNRKISIISNGTWAAMSHNLIKKEIETMKGMEIIGDSFVVKSAMTPQQSPELEELAEKIANSVLNK